MNYTQTKEKRLKYQDLLYSPQYKNSTMFTHLLQTLCNQQPRRPYMLPSVHPFVMWFIFCSPKILYLKQSRVTQNLPAPMINVCNFLSAMFYP